MRAALPACLLALALFGAPAPATAQEDGLPKPTAASEAQKLETVWNAIDGGIRPGYAAFDAAARAAAMRIGALCATPAQTTLEDARDGFGDLAEAWAGIEFVRFGPITEDHRLERVLFFPDRRGIALRQVQGLLGSMDESATTSETLAQKSVAVQGLTALEFVLFGDGAETLSTDGGTFRCAYGEAIAGNLTTISAAVREAWAEEEGIVGRLTAPKPTDPSYRSATDSLKAITDIFSEGFAIIRDLRLEPAMGKDATTAKPKLFLYHRSEHALSALSANFAGLKRIFEAADFGTILPEAQSYLPASIAFEFDNATGTLDALSPPLMDVATTPERRDRLDYVLIVTDSLRAAFSDQLAPALGLSSGFSSLDGD